ncbi:MAG: SPOR domain-containing protein [Alphaproteobacteria bacterium]
MADDDMDEDYIDESAEVLSGVARWVPPVVVVTALGGFMMLAWYAYQAGTQSVDENELLVVEADDTPIKEKPEDPGGMQFPNKDKMIFETFSSQGGEHPKVERLMPEPEEPVVITANESTTTFVNTEATQDKPAAVETPKEVKDDFVKQAALDKDAKNAGEEVKSFRKEAEEQPAAPVNIVESKPEPKAEPKQTEVAPASGGAMQIQLGAYRSHGEAEFGWKKIRDKNASLLSGRNHTIVKADLGAKGVYYRLRVTGFANMDSAKDFCNKLSARGQACMAVSG